MVEVDLRLFVTCRLCLEVEGHFQIIPSVQEQIKYCFDIDVEPFDRLPQLICKKCESILQEYHKIKKNFIEKQEELKAKVQNNEKNSSKPPPLPNVECDSHPDETNNSVKRKKKHKIRKGRKRIANRLPSSSSEDLDRKDVSALDEKQKKDICHEEPKPLEERFDKFYVCRICSKTSSYKRGIVKHLKEHKVLLRKHEKIFKTCCLVVLDKVEIESNKTTNFNNALVYDSTSIIEQNNFNSNYYILYHPKEFKDSQNEDESQSKNYSINYESTDEEMFSSKRRRRLSRSSIDTVVIKRLSEHEQGDVSCVSKDKNIPPTVIDFIDINDSSDSDSCTNNAKNKSLPINEETDNLKSIQNIIKMCYNKYAKTVDNSENKGSAAADNKVKVGFLQHKVLSIGIKIINNTGFNCTGLLRYTEYKDLCVIWKETSLNANADAKFARIYTTIKRNDNCNANKKIGWEVANIQKREYFRKLKQPNNFIKKLNKLVNFVIPKQPKFNDEVQKSTENLPRISSVFSQLDFEKTKTLDADSHLFKLLNTNPVSNPKQLPKKGNESMKISKVLSGQNPIVTCFDTQQTNENIEINFNTIPIVTSTVSLTTVENNEERNFSQNGDAVRSPNNSQLTNKTWLKVKPASELMEKTANQPIPTENGTFFNETFNALPFNNIPRDYNNGINSNSVMPILTLPFSEHQNNQNLVNKVSTTGSNNVPTTVSSTVPIKEYVWLHTPELPNTRTDSPFLYVKNLLLIHNLTLLDSNAPLPPNSASLIKLNLAYNQEHCSLSFMLLLFCSNYKFCIKVRDEQQKEVNISQFTANWQWQLLRVYTTDVINEVLKSAAKIGVSTLKNTQTFINLINSIQFTRDFTR